MRTTRTEEISAKLQRRLFRARASPPRSCRAEQWATPCSPLGLGRRCAAGDSAPSIQEEQSAIPAQRWGARQSRAVSALWCPERRRRERSTRAGSGNLHSRQGSRRGARDGQGVGRRAHLSRTPPKSSAADGERGLSGHAHEPGQKVAAGGRGRPRITKRTAAVQATARTFS